MKSHTYSRKEQRSLINLQAMVNWFNLLINLQAMVNWFNLLIKKFSVLHDMKECKREIEL